RLSDHHALSVAAGTQAAILPLYIHDDETEDAEKIGGASRWWLHESLDALNQSLGQLGGAMVIRRGRTADVLKDVLTETKAKALHATQSFEPFGTASERAAAAICADEGAAFHLHPGRLLFAPQGITTKDGRPYKVFTPFWKACLVRPPPPLPCGAPRIAEFASAAGLPLEDLKLQPTRPDWAGGLRAGWNPGERAAQTALTDFIETRIGAYAERRDDLPGRPTSRLSPHLHFGEISPAQVWHAVSHAVEVGEIHGGRGPETFLKELGWREFSYHLLHNFPHLPHTPLRAEFARFPWRDDPEALKAWQQGQTGYPVVDAAMRELWHTGYMQNRARMITASFLIKHLLLPWQVGASWFWDTLVDADLASNSASWQWVAGCGTDAAPYFRIFNPILQGRKFDPDGAYVRTWVPELAGLTPDDIHAPWDAPPAILAAAGVVLGKTYPHPIVDHGAARARALRALEAIK
ncbi:MAG: deoxyribodipyrimidine photo-lyase, partial [Pseudomonadota bacterium]